MIRGDETLKATADVVAGTITVGALMDALPAIAAGFTIIWTIFRIYETALFQKLIPNRFRVDEYKDKEKSDLKLKKPAQRRKHYGQTYL